MYHSTQLYTVVLMHGWWISVTRRQSRFHTPFILPVVRSARQVNSNRRNQGGKQRNWETRLAFENGSTVPTPMTTENALLRTEGLGMISYVTVGKPPCTQIHHYYHLQLCGVLCSTDPPLIPHIAAGQYADSTLVSRS